MTTQARELAGIISNAGDLSFGDDVTLKSDGSILNFGADSDVNLTHVADTALLLNSTRQLQFGDSDWMAIRKSDTGEAIPTAWKTYRDSVRTKSDSFKTAIDAVSTVDELAAIEYDWPSKPTN